MTLHPSLLPAAVTVPDASAMVAAAGRLVAREGAAVRRALVARYGYAVVDDVVGVVRCELRSDAFNADGFLRDPDPSASAPSGAWEDVYRVATLGRDALVDRVLAAGALLGHAARWHAEVVGTPPDLAVGLWAAARLLDGDPASDLLYSDGRLDALVVAGDRGEAGALETLEDHELGAVFACVVGDVAGLWVRAHLAAAIEALDGLAG